MKRGRHLISKRASDDQSKAPTNSSKESRASSSNYVASTNSLADSLAQSMQEDPLSRQGTSKSRLKPPPIQILESDGAESPFQAESLVGSTQELGLPETRVSQDALVIAESDDQPLARSGRVRRREAKSTFIHNSYLI